MGPVEWYYARGDKHQGPVPSAELKRLAIAGELRPDDLVWREGLAEWTAARNVQGLFEEKVKPTAAAGPGTKGIPTPPQVVVPHPSSEPTPAPGAVRPAGRSPTALLGGRHLFDVLLDYFRQLIPSQFVEATAQILQHLGSYGLLAGMGLCLLYGLLFSIKHNQIDALITGLIAFLVLALLQYGSGKFCEALERLNRSTTYVVCSPAYLDWSALSFFILAGVVLLGTSVPAVKAGSLVIFLFGLWGFIVCLYLAMIALHPESIQISIIPEIRAGEEAIGVFSFAFKSMVRLAPVLFGTGVAVGCLMMAYACVAIFGGAEVAQKKSSPASAPSIAEVSDLLQQLSGGGTAAANLSKAEELSGKAEMILYCSAAIPVAVYLLFLLYVLVVEACRALLVLPGKLDKISDEERATKNPAK